MRAQISGLEQASSNVKDGISLVKTGEGALQEVQDMLNRMVTLATQSANGTYDDDVDRANLQKEVDALKSEINRIADSSNFNGINLLDGSLAGGATSVSITGVSSKSSESVKGVYDSSQAWTALSSLSNGDSFEYTVALDDGTSYTAKFTIGKNEAGTVDAKGLYDGDGNFITDLGTASAVSVGEATSAILKSLQTSGKFEDYSITGNAGKFTFTAKEAGTDVAAVSAFGTKNSIGGTVSTVDLGVTTTKAARDDGREISASDITEYTGTNYDDAVFTINGHKFLLAATGVTNGTGELKTTTGVGADVTILMGGQDGLNQGDDYWDSNIAKIAEVTGLTVTDCVTETGSDNGINAGAGIRLSKGTNGAGLQLQIGDTAKSYNQLDVNVEDMHTTALGIKNIDISTQDGATAAIDVIKAAINKVSSTRGTLGAVQNRLEHTQNNLSVMTENIQDAESTIRDTDIAEEMMSYTKNNILVQSAQAMLAQANSVPQGVLQLLQ
jgi:flagellin